ncbi:MAG: proteasome accessory factor PafA2 family protein, partial [Planctomycetota bacterium]
VLGNAVLAAVFLPGIRVYSAFLRLAAFPRFVRHLTPFLATRQILTGSGSLNFRRGRYELSQRAGMTRSLGKIVTRGPRKTVFDFKAFLYAPSALFREAKRMSLVLADSNLSDVPNLLKVGTTALVIEMVEAGVSFDSLRLRSPVEALREVSAGGPWKLLRLRSGLSKTAVEIQRAYLEKAREHFRGRPEGRIRHGEILALWEETLERLADRPTALADTLDWAAKKSILDEAILPRTNWRTFFDWGRVFEAAGLEAAAAASGLEDLFRRAPPLRRLRARSLAERAALDPEEFRLQRELHFQARKIDLRFHEIGGGAGYQRALEAEGLIRRLAGEAEVLRATTSPPQDTRARIRAYYIEHSPDPELLLVDWTEIELRGHALYIPLPDPFAHRLPLE